MNGRGATAMDIEPAEELASVPMETSPENNFRRKILRAAVAGCAKQRWRLGFSLRIAEPRRADVLGGEGAGFARGRSQNTSRYCSVAWIFCWRRSWRMARGRQHLKRKPDAG